MIKNKLPKLTEQPKEYQDLVFAVLRAMSRPETESEYYRQIVAGLNFDNLYNGVIIWRNIPAYSGVTLRGFSGKHYKPEQVYRR